MGKQEQQSVLAAASTATAPQTTPTSSSLPTLVAAVDNDHMALLAFKGILPQLLPGARWLWGVGTASEAIAKTLDPETRPRLLMVDMSLGETSGVSVCRKIRARTDRVRLLAITAFTTDTYAAQAAEAGAQGIVSKADMPQLAKALRVVAAGGTFNPDPASKTVFLTAEQAHERLTRGISGNALGPAGSNVGDAADDGLTDAPKLGAKEADTLHLLSRGLSYEQIAEQWGGHVDRAHACASRGREAGSELARPCHRYMAGIRALRIHTPSCTLAASMPPSDSTAVRCNASPRP